MKAIKVLSQMAHPIRLRLLCLLLENELCVCEMEDILDIRQVNISKHLQKLKDAGLLDVRRDKQRAFYRASPFIKNERTLVVYLAEQRRQEAMLLRDARRFEQHEQTKDKKVYVCNISEVTAR